MAFGQILVGHNRYPLQMQKDFGPMNPAAKPPVANNRGGHFDLPQLATVLRARGWTNFSSEGVP